MITFITLILLVFTLLVSFYFYKNIFNHLNLYALGWSLFIVLYQMKLIKFIDVQMQTWMIILFSYLSLFLGSITIFIAKKNFDKKNTSNTIKQNFITPSTIKYIKYLIVFFALIGLFAALQNWFILIQKYGSVAKVLLKANTIYRDRIAGDVVTGIPYLFIASNISLFFAGIYSAYKKRITFIVILPFLGIILKGIASVGRGGIFVGFLQFIITLLLFYFYLRKHDRENYKLNINSYISIILVIVIAVGSMAIVKEIRGSFDNYKGTSKSLQKFEGGIISPQIYLYFSSNIGVLSKYFEKDIENVHFGENTFLPIYNLISKFGIIEHPRVYPRGYFIPMWTNSATYLRDFHADFGFVGLFLVPYILGLLTSYHWIKFYNTGKLLNFVVLTYLNIIISFSVFYMITRASSWLISFLFLLFFVPILEKYLIRKGLYEKKM